MSFPRRLFAWWKRAPRDSGGARPRRPLWWSRLAVHQNTFFRTPLDRLLPTLQLGGIRGVGLSLDRLTDWSESEIVREVIASGLSVSSVGVIGGFTRHNGYTHDEAVQDGFDRIEMARSLRASCVRVISGPIAGHLNKHARRLLIDGLRSLLPAAQEAGVRLALQPMFKRDAQWTFLHSWEAAEAIVRDINHPALGLALGAVQMPSPEDLLPSLERLAPWIASLQLSDQTGSSSRYESRLPGRDNLALLEMIQALESFHYRGWYELEVWSRDLWKLSSEILMEQCQKSLGCLVPATAPADA